MESTMFTFPSPLPMYRVWCSFLSAVHLSGKGAPERSGFLEDVKRYAYRSSCLNGWHLWAIVPAVMSLLISHRVEKRSGGLRMGREILDGRFATACSGMVLICMFKAEVPRLEYYCAQKRWPFRIN